VRGTGEVENFPDSTVTKDIAGDPVSEVGACSIDAHPTQAPVEHAGSACFRCDHRNHDDAAMATPVLVKAYPITTTTPVVVMRRSYTQPKENLPPISSFAFADILRAADSKDFQQALDGIAEICAKNRMSLSDEHSSHLPPLGEITSANASSMLARPQLLRPGMRRALTSVPEGSSGSSEGSRGSKKRGSGLFGLRKSQDPPAEASPMPKRMRIGSLSRSMTSTTTTALASSVEFPRNDQDFASNVPTGNRVPTGQEGATRRTSIAATSLQRLLQQTSHDNNG
jgi:hypothetical protein